MRYRFVCDDDCHWYLIPLNIEDEFNKWIDYNNSYDDYSEIGPWEGTDFDLMRTNPYTITFENPAEDE